MTPKTAAWLLVLLCMATSARAEWPLLWDFDGQRDEPVDAALLPSGHDLFVLASVRIQASTTPRSALVRISPAGEVVWQADDPEMAAPGGFALAPDGRALLLGRNGTATRVTAVAADGTIAWSRERTGLDISPFFSEIPIRPHWDEESGAWWVPAGAGGDFVVLGWDGGGDPLPDRVWSPPEGEARATSVLSRPGGGLLVAGTLFEVASPGWWVVALDAAGAEDWSRFEDGDTDAGIFSGAFLLDADPVRLWADDETPCGLFSLRLWALDPDAGSPLWARTWPAPAGCSSFEPDSVRFEGDRLLASGATNHFPGTGGSAAVALAFDAATGAPLWERIFDGATTTIRADLASVDGSALLATTLFPPSQPGATPVWTAAWSRDGVECGPPQQLLPSMRAVTTVADGAGWYVVGYASPGSTLDDVVVHRAAAACDTLFSDGFESGDTSTWSTAVP